jgi:hypothetical protein
MNYSTTILVKTIQYEYYNKSCIQYYTFSQKNCQIYTVRIFAGKLVKTNFDNFSPKQQQV